MKPILLVDDEIEIAELWQDVLEEEGYRIISANSGTEAVKQLEQQEIALLVTDMKLPDMSGWDVIASARKRNPSLPVIAASGDTSAIGAEQKDKIDRVLTKPFRIDDFAATVGKLLKERSAG